MSEARMLSKTTGDTQQAPNLRGCHWPKMELLSISKRNYSKLKHFNVLKDIPAHPPPTHKYEHTESAMLLRTKPDQASYWSPLEDARE